MEETLKFKIIAIGEETPEAKTYQLEPLNGSINFRPGQFLTFIFHFEHEELRRSFSIVSLPGEPIRITVQRVENGAVSRYILMHWKEGDIIESLAPAGRFTLAAQQGYPRNLFFLAAGSGIAPILPQIRYLLKNEPQSNIYLFYSNSTENRILFKKDIDELEKNHRQFSVLHFLSNPKSNWQKRQRINNGILELLVNEHMKYEPAKAVFMICGPFTYMRMVRMTLIYMKFNEEQILTEHFLPEIMRSGTRTTPNYPDRKVQITIQGHSHQILVKSGQTILRAALGSGLKLPYSCEGGVCSACAAICEKGKVKMTINEVLTNKDLEQGWILTCTGHPAGEGVAIYYP